jgi:tetratricopeptide (TPR) repeat protein
MKQSTSAPALGLSCLLLLAPSLLAPSLLAQEPAAPTQDRATGKAADTDRCAALRKGVAKDPLATLGRFEAELEKAPNDLRCGSDYRRLIIATEAFDRSIDFFEKLVAAHPDAANAYLNLGYALVDKIPVEGAITQVLMANTALGYFSKALELEETWVGYYTRGNSYLFWPAIFGRTALGLADLEKAIALSKTMEKKDHHARAWAALGDGYWRLDDVAKARETWKQGLELFPENPHLVARASRNDEELDAFLESHFETGNRVDTDLAVLWEGGF